MSDTPETLSAILAEMTEFCSGWSEDVDVTVKVGLIYGWKCRIEAAAERERNEHTNDIHDALYKATGIPGNAAEMRAALNRVGHLAKDLRNITERDTEVRADVNEIVDVCRAALSAPARNCDRFDNYLDARAEYDGNLGSEEWRFGAWLFAPAEGGAE